MTVEEIYAAARKAKSPEEILKLAHDNGQKDFTELNAVAYYEAIHKSGELSDDELENAAGGCKSSGRRIVSLGCACPDGYKFWRCKHCLTTSSYCHCTMWHGVDDWAEKTGASLDMKVKEICGTCAWCSYETGVWYCNNDEANKC